MNVFLCWLASSSPSDWLSGFAAATLAGAAVFGLNAWRREHVGKERYVAAKELMAEVYAYRDSLLSVRNPLRRPEDYSDEYASEGLSKIELKDPASEDATQALYERLARNELHAHQEVFKNRFNRVADARSTLSQSLSRAEVVLGSRNPKLEHIDKMYSDLWGAWRSKGHQLWAKTLPKEQRKRELENPPPYQVDRVWPHEREVFPDDFDKMLDSEVSVIRGALKVFLPVPK